jgi:Txe/YoeB family toxin of Txe-Axe toxin-antitoxin module
MISRTVPGFWQMYRRPPRKIRNQARAAYEQFRADPAHPGLHFYRLESEKRLWSVRITRNHRAVGLVRGDTITWFWVGDHEAFDRDFPR